MGTCGCLSPHGSQGPEVASLSVLGACPSCTVLQLLEGFGLVCPSAQAGPGGLWDLVSELPLTGWVPWNPRLGKAGESTELGGGTSRLSSGGEGFESPHPPCWRQPPARDWEESGPASNQAMKTLGSSGHTWPSGWGAGLRLHPSLVESHLTFDPHLQSGRGHRLLLPLGLSAGACAIVMVTCWAPSPDS